MSKKEGLGSGFKNILFHHGGTRDAGVGTSSGWVGQRMDTDWTTENACEGGGKPITLTTNTTRPTHTEHTLRHGYGGIRTEHYSWRHRPGTWTRSLLLYSQRMSTDLEHEHGVRCTFAVGFHYSQPAHTDEHGASQPINTDACQRAHTDASTSPSNMWINLFWEVMKYYPGKFSGVD